jgi:hypothetical protein
MGLRILDDGRPGYAILEFDSALDAPSLSISIRSALQQGAYLGVDGKWQKAPHFFTAQRVDGDASASRYRVGPEIVNHLVEADQIGVATADGRNREETEWTNAAPEIGARSPHRTIYRPPAAPPAIQPISPVSTPPAPAAALADARALAPWEVPTAGAPTQDAGDALPVRAPSGRRWILPGAVALVLILFMAAGAASWLVPDLRCRLFGGVCPNTDEWEARIARVCADTRQTANLQCEVQSVCVAPYLTKFPDGRFRTELEERGLDAALVCSEDESVAKTARTCADEKQAGNLHCDVQQACIVPYLSRFPAGRFRAELEGRGNDAMSACASQEEDAARTARTCADQRQASGRHCEVQQACIAPYLSRFPAGRFQAELEGRGNDALRACASQEDAAARTARACADQRQASNLHCDVQQACIAPYLTAFPTGRFRAELELRGREANRQCANDEEAARNARACANQRQASNLHCEIQPACVAPYLSAFPAGRFRAELEGRGRTAAAVCAEGTAAQRARACTNARQASGQVCEVQTACVAPYLRDYPNGASRRDVEANARDAVLACDEDRAFNAATACASTTDGCQVEEICFRPYFSRYPNARHRERAQAEIARGRARCIATPPRPRDGAYQLSFRSPACGERPQFGKRFVVTGGRVSWQHEFRGTTFLWSGTIDADGNIRAATGLSGTRASGRQRGSDQFVEMYYPQCGPVRGEIGGLL